MSNDETILDLLPEVDWLRSFHWSDETICDHFKITLDSLQQVERRLAKKVSR